MAAETLTISTLASEAAGWFERRYRDGGELFTTTRGGAPDWIRELVREAHDGMLPDDWRYDCVWLALRHIGDEGAETSDDLDDAGSDFADIYTSDLLAWADSNAYRLGYVDDAARDGLIDETTPESQRLAIGQYVEAREVFEIVRSQLSDRLDELTD